MNTLQRLVNSSSFHFRIVKGSGGGRVHLLVVTECRDYSDVTSALTALVHDLRLEYVSGMAKQIPTS